HDFRLSTAQAAIDRARKAGLLSGEPDVVLDDIENSRLRSGKSLHAKLIMTAGDILEGRLDSSRVKLSHMSLDAAMIEADPNFHRFQEALKTSASLETFRIG